jgi:ABC-type branched-subunit amino acid transport system ATPase component
VLELIGKGALAYGLEKILDVGMALTARAAMLLIDEPAASLDPVGTMALAGSDQARACHWHRRNRGRT